MSFIWPPVLILLVLVPIFVLLYLRLMGQRRQIAEKSGSLGFVRAAVGQQPGLRRHIPPIFFLAALTILIIALARPQTEINLPRIEGTVILAFDVSGSMAADDLNPTRMDAAKAAAQNFIEKQPPFVQIGVMAFSDSGLSVQTPTNDQGEVLAAIDRLKPERGTALGNGILASLKAIEDSETGQDTNYYSNLTPTPAPTPTPVPPGTHKSAVIVLLSDGENNQRPDPLEAAQQAADRGVRIFTVGIGSAAGSDLHVEGFTIHSQLDEATLQQIAQITDGTYYNATNEADLRSIYDNLDPQLIIKPQQSEVTSIFAGIGILVLLMGGAISLVWFGRLP